MCALFPPITPANIEYQKIEARVNNDLVNSCYRCNSESLIEQYVLQISNIESQTKTKKSITKLEKLKKLGLIGSLNNSDITSTNYKASILADEENQ